MKDETCPLSGKVTTNKVANRMPSKSKFSIVISTAATIVAILSCIAFTYFFRTAMSGFSKQVNAFVAVGDFSSTAIQLIILLLCVCFILYLFFSYLSAVKVVRAVPCLGSPVFLFLSSFTSQGFLIGWVVLMCFVSSMTLVYFIFIGGIYSFCALLDQQCFDFKVLVPAIVSKISNKKVDMVFCETKKELLCSQKNNQIWSFGISFACCLLTFAGALMIQNCVVFGLGKKRGTQQTKKEEQYELKELS